MFKVALVTNIPAPYRVPVLNALARVDNIVFKAFYAASRESDRRWDLPNFDHDHVYLKERFRKRNGLYIHNNMDVWPALCNFKPDVVITTGFNPTHLYAFAYAKLARCAHIGMTDGTMKSEAGFSLTHRLVRRVVYGQSAAAIVASEGGRDLLQKVYRMDAEKVFKAALCANGDVVWSTDPWSPRLIDFIFAGRFVAGKRPLFAIDVAVAVAKRLGRRVSIDFIGSGPLDEKIRAKLADQVDWVQGRMLGFLRQDELPAAYRAAKVFLFPTAWDTWGVVANEAMQAGTAVLVTPDAGVTDDLVVDGETGLVRQALLNDWVDAAAALLTNPPLWVALTDAASLHVANYSHLHAAAAMQQAIYGAVGLGIRS